MPGYQQIRFMPTPTEFYHNEPIYGHTMDKKKKKKDKSSKKQPHQHPLFEDLKAKHQRDRKEYERMIAAREHQGNDFNPYKYDSLKLIGSCNDVSYLDNFMSMPRQHPRSSQSQQELYQKSSNRVAQKGGLSKSSSTVFGKGQKEHRNSVQSDSAITAAIMANLRNASSEDNIYESVEMIHYKKTVQNLNRIEKTRSLQKTGHPLFDHLREEQALRGPSKRKTLQKELHSDGHSPSSSSSGDEYETYPRMRYHPSQHQQAKAVKQNYMQEQQKKDKSKQKARRAESSESDEDWRMIPRPKFFVGSRQNAVAVRKVSQDTDESDSSINSTILR